MSSTCSNIIVRGSLLFGVGYFFALVLNLLQVQRQFTVFPSFCASLFSSEWWIPISVGTAAAFIGLLYPVFDERFGETPSDGKREWSSVMRCVAVFVGINHASAKIDFSNNLQFSLTLAVMSIALWWLFDRSRSGFGLGVLIALLATLFTHFLVYNGIFSYSEPDFLYVRSSLPSIFFSGGVTMGNIGRQLALSDYSDSKEHHD